ncbi:hypothetical protein BKA81DRAFT_24677 [Phyllosticta paracitricarpa]
MPPRVQLVVLVRSWKPDEKHFWLGTSAASSPRRPSLRLAPLSSSTTPLLPRPRLRPRPRPRPVLLSLANRLRLRLRLRLAKSQLPLPPPPSRLRAPTPPTNYHRPRIRFRPRIRTPAQNLSLLRKSAGASPSVSSTFHPSAWLPPPLASPHAPPRRDFGIQSTRRRDPSPSLRIHQNRFQTSPSTTSRPLALRERGTATLCCR